MVIAGRGGIALKEVEAPSAGSGELVVRVSVCAVCRTDLDLLEGRLRAPAYPVIPGHQVVGTVAELGAGASGFTVGDRVGIAWIHSACGVCDACGRGEENLCAKFESTGCDAPGGYAEFTSVPAAFAHRIPAALDDAHAAPLLCAGAIGWRALRLAGIRDGDALGLTGFGASAHLVLQIARARFPRSEVFVFARSEHERDFARSLGAEWTGDTADAPPQALDAIIDTTPAWKPVVEALPRLRPGGRLVINAIRKETKDQPELQRLDYATHLWMEREIKSVANVTRADVRETLEWSATHSLRPAISELPLDRAAEALASFHSAAGVHGSKVLRVA